jgi:FixJ family two-component response regulator
LRPQEKPALSESPVISIIDDDGSVRSAIYNFVRSLGYIVHAFASAEVFLRSPQLDGTSCVIADVQMPTMSGVELQTLLLAQGHRVRSFSSRLFPLRAFARALKAGATCFLTKPFDGETLIKCLDAALGGRGMSK